MTGYFPTATDRVKPEMPVVSPTAVRRPAGAGLEVPEQPRIGTTRSAQEPSGIRRKEECPPEVYIG